MEDIFKIIKSLEGSGLLLKGVTKTVQNEVKEQKGGFLGMLLGTLGASLLGNLLTGKGIYRAGKGKGIKRADEGIVRAVMVVLHPLLHIIIKWIFNTTVFSSNVNDPTFKKCLFGVVTLTKNADIDKYGYSVMELDLIEEEVFHFQVVDLVKRY